MGGDEEPREPSWYSPDTPELMEPEDLGARATSLRASLMKMPELALCTTKSYSKFLMPQPSRGPAPTISTLAAPYGVPSVPGTSVVNATISHR
jgi:hypothetical protein